MTVVREAHEAHGATFREVAGRAVPAEYGRPGRTHRAVRNAVGVTEHPFDVLVVAGEGRHSFVDGALTNRVPESDGAGRYALVLDDEGRVRADCYAFATGDRLLCFLPAGTGDAVADDWRSRAGEWGDAGDGTGGVDVDLSVATGEFGTFGVHGPTATEKVASVLHGASTPDERLSFVRGEMEGGVTVVRDDDLAGEEGYLVVCAADDAPDVFETLLVRGVNAPPFGRETWETLTLEAGTPLFETELRGRRPTALGLANAVDRGDWFVGRADPPAGEKARRLVGLDPDALPAAGAAVRAGGDVVGAVTRAAVSPMRDDPVAFAVVDADALDGDLAVETGDGRVDAAFAELPFVESGERSARLPQF